MKGILAFLLAFGGMAGMAFADPHDVYGTFATLGGSSHVEISDCGDGTPCGRIIWIDPDSLPDGITPETAVGKTGATLLGMQMLEGFERKKKGWRGGVVYDAENDKRYKAGIKRLEDGSLHLKGCVGPFCQTQVWQQVGEQIAFNR